MILIMIFLKMKCFRIFPSLTLKTLKNVEYFKSYLKFMKTLKFRLFFGIPSSKFNETTSFWTHFIENFDGIQFITRTNFITHRIQVRII